MNDSATRVRYRDRWTWDRVTWGGHAVDCYPCWGSCPVRVYVRDGRVIREEQAGTLLQVEAGIPDPNPLGCQVGCGWSRTLDGAERVLHPLRRVGERGSGRWEQISWEEALTEAADGFLDALQEAGPDAIVDMAGGNALGAISAAGRGQFMRLLGGLTTDVDAEVSDFSPGAWLTFGKLPDQSWEDDFHAGLVVIWNMNPAYTRVPVFHYLAEARYHGAEVVLVAPDVSPSAMHADYFVPVRPGTDAALCLSICHVLVEEALVDRDFVIAQTDLPLLVRCDTGRFLRGSDLLAGGADDQFYAWDLAAGKAVAAPAATLDWGPARPALEGRYLVRLDSGAEAEVRPVFELLRARLAEYAPEAAAAVCGTGPDVIRALARKMATRRTRVHEGRGGGKHFHSDLMERSMLLALGLSGNWGKRGAGMETWSIVAGAGTALFQAKERPGAEETERILRARESGLAAVAGRDPSLTQEMAEIRLARAASARGHIVPPFFLWWRHAGFREVWERQSAATGAPRPFAGLVEEALEAGWWGSLARPSEDVRPRVLLQFGGNVLRRTRGGQGVLLSRLWPGLKLIVTIDFRMSTTALFSDLVLPAANHHEKMAFGLADPELLFFNFMDRAVPPAGESLNDWEIFGRLLQRIEERAADRAFLSYRDSLGNAYRLDGLYDAYMKGGAFEDEERIADEMVRDSALAGSIPRDTTLARMRQVGVVRYTDWGLSPMGASQGSDLKADEAHAPLRNHVERWMPYPTLTRRAQFYIDHEWFLEAGEALPAHKDPPKLGGEYPLRLTSGHNRWSIHSTNIANALMLDTHRGTPNLAMNPGDAVARGVADGDSVRVFNDMGSFVVAAKITAGVQPGQVVCYNGWEPYQFAGWKGPNEVETNMVKWLHLVHGYGHLAYYPMVWQPVPADRSTCVEVAGAP